MLIRGSNQFRKLLGGALAKARSSGSAPPPSYSGESVSSPYLVTTGNFPDSGTLNGAGVKKMVMSLWLKPTAASGNRLAFGNMALTSMASANGFGVGLSGTKLKVNVNAITGGTFATNFTDTDDLALNSWHHVILALDIPNSKADLWVDDVNQSLTPCPDTYNIYIEGGNPVHFFNALVAGTVFAGEIGEVFLDFNHYLDVSVEANRRKFLTASGTPEDLGADGSTPLGVQPLAYWKGNSSEFATNVGSLGSSLNLNVTAGISDGSDISL